MPAHTFLLGLEFAVYALAYVALVWALVRAIAFLTHGTPKNLWRNAFLCILFTTACQRLSDSRYDVWFPQVTAEQQIWATLGACLTIAFIALFLSFPIGPFHRSIVALALATSIKFGTQQLPQVIDQMLPPGQRLGAYVDESFTRTDEAVKFSRKMRFKTVNESAGGIFAPVWNSLVNKTAVERLDNIRTQIRNDREFYADRKALLASMSTNEGTQYRQAVAEFIKSQGLAQEHFALDAIQVASLEDVRIQVAYLEGREAKANQAAASISTADPASEVTVNVLLDSFVAVLRFLADLVMGAFSSGNASRARNAPDFSAPSADEVRFLLLLRNIHGRTFNDKD